MLVNAIITRCSALLSSSLTIIARNIINVLVLCSLLDDGQRYKANNFTNEEQKAKSNMSTLIHDNFLKEKSWSRKWRTRHQFSERFCKTCATTYRMFVQPTAEDDKHTVCCPTTSVALGETPHSLTERKSNYITEESMSLNFDQQQPGKVEWFRIA